MPPFLNRTFSIGPILLLLLLVQASLAADTNYPWPPRQQGRPASDSPPGQPNQKKLPDGPYKVACLWADMFMTVPLPQAPTHSYKDLVDFGWRQQPDEPFPSRPRGFAEAFLHGIGLRVEQDVERMYYYCKANDITLADSGHVMTHFGYDQFVSVAHGVIAVLWLSTPHGELVDERTRAVGELSSWQAFMPVLWQKMCSSDKKKSWPCSELQWVAFTIVRDDSMLAIMKRAMGGTLDSVPKWPGMSFLPSHEPGRALLGSLFGMQVARLLAAHHDIFNDRVVDEIHVYSPTGNGEAAIAFRITRSSSSGLEMSGSNAVHEHGNQAVSTVWQRAVATGRSAVIALNNGEGLQPQSDFETLDDVAPYGWHRKGHSIPGFKTDAVRAAFKHFDLDPLQPLEGGYDKPNLATYILHRGLSFPSGHSRYAKTWRVSGVEYHASTAEFLQFVTPDRGVLVLQKSVSIPEAASLLPAASRPMYYPPVGEFKDLGLVLWKT